jgi:hypothetical protein
MSYQCLLTTEGYQVSFNLNPRPDLTQYLDLILEFSLTQPGAPLCLQSAPTLMAINDLQRLLDYFEFHLAQLKQQPDSESYPFVPLELGFQLQALAGEIQEDLDGEFNLRFMINISKTDEEQPNTYFGGEAPTTLKRLQDFTSSLKTVLTNLSPEDESSIPQQYQYG